MSYSVSSSTFFRSGLLVLLALLAGLLGCRQQRDVSLRDHVTPSGTVEASERWSGKIKLTGDVVIPEGITVSVQPGANINFTSASDHDVRITAVSDSTEVLTHDGLIDIIVRGDFQISATEKTMVYVGTDGKKGTFGWGSLIFIGSNESSEIRYVEIKHGQGAVVFADSSKARLENALVSFGGINVRTFDWARPAISNNRLKNAFAAVYSYGMSQPVIRDNRLETLTHGIGTTNRSQPSIEGNIIHSTQTGVICMDAAQPRLTQNTIQDNDRGLVVRDRCRPVLKENDIKNNKQQDVVGLER